MIQAKFLNPTFDRINRMNRMGREEEEFLDRINRMNRIEKRKVHATTQRVRQMRRTILTEVFGLKVQTTPVA